MLMLRNLGTDHEEDVLVMDKTEVKKENMIILHNDDVNNFNHVISCLVKYCKHQEEQALQCALIVHNNGKCDVKRGTMKVLRPIKEALQENGLKVTIE